MDKCFRRHLYPVSSVVADLIYGWIRATFDNQAGPVEAAQPRYFKKIVTFVYNITFFLKF